MFGSLIALVFSSADSCGIMFLLCLRSGVLSLFCCDGAFLSAVF